MRTSHVALCFVVVCSAVLSLPVHAQSFKVGLSNVDITPMNNSYELQGYGIDRRAEPGKYDDPDHPAYAGAGFCPGYRVRFVS